MVASVEASLRRLKTDRIDIYWAHWPDHVTPSEEIVRGFEDLARAGKILYAGLSNFTAWRLARAVTLAELTRAVPLAAAQFEHSLVQRAPEADRKSTRLNSSHYCASRMPSYAWIKNQINTRSPRPL